MRACLIGTTAYQLYGPLLGIRLPNATLQSAQMRNRSDFSIIYFTRKYKP